jgi:serine/threonine protein kinase
MKPPFIQNYPRKWGRWAAEIEILLCFFSDFPTVVQETLLLKDLQINFVSCAESEPMKLRSLSLDDRLRIAVNVAWCLNYLHNERAIPHGNLKSTNILLEPQNMNPLLTDCSLHRILTSAGTAEQVLNAGALGYRAT